MIAFGSNGASTMVGKKIGVASCLKKLNPFLTFVHCVAHRTNLGALEAPKNVSCKAISTNIDNILNKTTAYFKKSAGRRQGLYKLQVELFDAKRSFKRYHKIKWLSIWQSITSLCDSLESVLTYFCDIPTKKDDKDAPFLYETLRSFKTIYCFFFWLTSCICFLSFQKFFNTNLLMLVL
jgi:hypothetical protein